MRVTLSSDFFIAFFGGLACIGSLWGYFEYHFAHADDLNAVRDSVINEKEERKELKAEVDAMYLRFIPPPEQAPLKHPEKITDAHTQ